MKPGVTRGIAVAVFVAVTCSGCVIDVDLTSTPDSAAVGQSVKFEVKATNPLQCPVGGVVGFLFPFIPKDHVIGGIANDELREHLSGFVDALCSGEDAGIPDGVGNCQIVEGDIICDFRVVGTVPQAPPVAMATTTGGDQVTCGADGDKIVCRIPQALVQKGEQAAAEMDENNLFPFECQQIDGIAVCGTLALGPGEMKMDEIEFTPEQPGLLHNFVVMFATRSGGVCQSGLLPGLPCTVDDQCGGGTPECASGICDGGKNGFGCDSDSECTATGFCLGAAGNKRCAVVNAGAPCTTAADCTATGTCVQCEPPDDGQVLPGLACSSTFAVSAQAAPAMSPWGAVLLVLALGGVAAVTLRAHAARRA